MSYLQQCLNILGITDDFSKINLKYLKNVFKTKVLESHPDRDGSNEDFDKIMNAYIQLHETYIRMQGGRNSLHSSILTPDELRNMRGDEIINAIFQEFDNQEFNKKFEESHVSDLGHGYQDWLKQESDTFRKSLQNMDSESENNGILKTEITPENFNSIFEKSVKSGKPVINHTSIISIDSIALDKSYGSSLIQSEINEYSSYYPSELQYTDIHTAYTDSTIIDKLPELSNYNNILKHLDNLKESRENPITITDDEKNQLLEYERQQFEKDKKHRDNLIKSYGENAFNNKLSYENTNKDNNNINMVIEMK